MLTLHIKPFLLLHNIGSLLSAFALTMLINTAAYSDNNSHVLSNQPVNPGHYEVAVYYFPGWHVDPINTSRRGGPWTEWEKLKSAKPKFPGHAQPKIPLWGYEMENDPHVMAQKIDAAASHGVSTFIFDWYYNENGPYLSGALERGYLKAPNRNRIKFAIMWANHKLLGQPGEVSRITFEKISDHIVHDYFTNPAYWMVEDKPYFSIYEIRTFINGMGGIQKARDALDYLRSEAIAAGLKGVHLNIVDWQIRNRPDAAKLLRILGADSVTTYTWVHIVPLKDIGFPTVDYVDVANRYRNYADTANEKYGVPYYPNVIMGWDSTPRMNPDQPFDGRGYPNTSIIVNNTPENFQAILQKTKTNLTKSPSSSRIVTINAWNEWGEGSYLEPDVNTGMKYLDAICSVFCDINK